MRGAATLPLPGRAEDVQHTAADQDRLQPVRVGYCVAVGVAAVIQLLFFWDVEANLASTLLALVSSLVGIVYSLGSARFRAHPVSALIMLLYTTTATSGALVVKSLEWSPIAGGLLAPVTTFSVLFGTQLSLLAADQLYLRIRAFGAARDFITHRMLKPLHLLRWPTDQQLWLLGLIGCASVLLTGTDFESDATFGFASAGTKLIRAFGFLKFAPFLIPFRNAMSGFPSARKSSLLALGLYFVGLVVISFATNSRSTFADALPTVGICFLIAMALGRIDFKRVSIVKIATFAIVAVVGGILLSRVALAMVVVRDYRQNTDITTLVGMTLEAMFSSEWLEMAKAKMDTALTIDNYSETYVDSRFFGRFLLTKFHDNIIHYCSLMGPDQIASYKEFMADRVLATLPDPFLRALDISVNKQDLIVSNGDYIIYLVDGWGLGGFKTGSMIGEVYGIYGWAFPLVMIGCGLLLYVLYDAFATPTSRGRMVFSPLILLLIWNLCGTTAAFGLGAESITAVLTGVLRGMPQNVLVYLMALMLVKGISRLTGDVE